jgi:hypothetical protein
MCPNLPLSSVSVSELEAQASQALMMGQAASGACAAPLAGLPTPSPAHVYAMQSMHSAPSFLDAEELCSNHAVLRHCGSLDGPMG